VGLLN